MKLKLLRWVVPFLCLTTTITQAQVNIKCLQNLTIRMARGGTELVNCVGDGLVDTVKFRPSSLATPIYYLVTEDDLTIRAASLKPTIDFEELGPGSYRVYALSFVGLSYVEVGKNAGSDVLASTCYELSRNYIPVINIDPDGQSVSTTGGATSVLTCTGDGNPDMVDFTTTSTDPFYAYLITDENNIIQAVSDDGRYDFEGGPPATLRVWGVSFVGELLAAPGQDATTAVLADRCFDLSDNFIEVTKTIPDGGTVAIDGGGEQALICIDETPDVLSFEASTSSQGLYTFLLTDAENIIIEFMEGDSRDFNTLPAGVCRVWGLSYTGNLTAGPGDNAAATALSDDCYDLSDNFVELTKKDPEGGRVVLESGAPDTTLCVNDGNPDLLTFTNTAESNENYVYILTNEQNFILRLDEDGIIDFEGSPPGVSRVWGIGYTGNLTVEVGDDLDDFPYSDECSERSTAFVDVTGITVDGGTVSTGGSDQAIICLGDETSDILSFSVEGAGATGAFIYVVTDETNQILTFSEDSSIDFSTALPGICRVWGLNYTGTLTAQPGDDAAATDLSDGCYDLSDNFVTVRRQEVDGGQVQILSSGQRPRVCVDDGQPDLLNFGFQSSADASYAFIVTNRNNQVLFVSEAAEIDFEGQSRGQARVYGLSYTGNLTVSPGADINSTALADECYDLSANYITVVRITLDGGNVRLAGGATSTAFCSDTDPADQNLQFSTTGGQTGAYAYLVTDEANVIVALTPDGLVDFSLLPVANYRVWGLNYTGELTAETGQDAAQAVLSSECYELSSNFVEITVTPVAGGEIRFADGSETATVCNNDGAEAILDLRNDNARGNYVYVLVDPVTNTVVQIGESSTLTLSDFPEDTGFDVYGLAYAGELGISADMPWDPAAVEALPCHMLAANTLRVEGIYLAVDSFTFAQGDPATALACLDEQPGSFPVSAAFAGPAFRTIIADEQDRFIAFGEAGQVDLSPYGPGAYHIYGVALTDPAIITIAPGDPVPTTPVSSSCYFLTDFFNVARLIGTDGGEVALDDGSTSALFCLSTPEATAQVAVATNSASTESYVFLVTDENNIVESVVEGPAIAFDGSADRRIWGLSYSGSLLVQPGDDAAGAVLAGECYDLSDNFISVRTRIVNGGAVALNGGGEQATTCPDDAAGDVLTFTVSGASETAAGVLLLTDAANIIRQVSTTTSIDFSALPVGDYRVWHLSYTGNLTAMPGEDAGSAALSDECFDLSGNFVAVRRFVPDAGAISLEGGDNQQICLSDGLEDIIRISTTSTSPDYLFVLVSLRNFEVVQVSEDGEFVLTEPAPEETPGYLDELTILGIAHAGDLVIEAGSQLPPGFADQLDCVDVAGDYTPNLSTYFLSAPALTLEGGSESTTICLSTLSGSTLRPDPGNFIAETYFYLITDTEDRLLGATTSEIDFAGFGAGEYRVYGLASTGALPAGFEIGQPLPDTPAAGSCYELTNNAVAVTVEDVLAGPVSLADGSTDGIACVGDGQPDLFEFLAPEAPSAGFRFLITDEANRLLTIVDGDSFDFDPTEPGVCRVWGLSFTGELLAEEGEIITEAPLASGCFGLSSNHITILRKSLLGGIVTLTDGSTATGICAVDEVPDIVEVQNTGVSTAAYTYLVTGTDNLIVRIEEGPAIDFTGLPFGEYRIWGLAYSGNLIAEIGDDAGQEPLSDEFYNLSDNFVTVSSPAVDGGSIGFSGGEAPLIICAGDDTPDLIQVEASGNAGAYTFLLVEQLSGIIVDLSESGSFTRTQWGMDEDLRVVGVASAVPLDIAPGTPFADLLAGTTNVGDCYALSNQLEIDVTFEIGGRVTFEDGSEAQTVCVGDGAPDLLTFQQNSLFYTDYAFLITDERNIVQDIVPGPQAASYDFESMEEGIARIWGMAYSGALTVAPGDDAAAVALSDGCYGLSDNFLTVTRRFVDGGTVAIAGGALQGTACVGDGIPDVFEFVSATASTAAYAFIVTDDSDEILVVLAGNRINFDVAPVGSCRVYGVSYTGNLTNAINVNIRDIPLSDECYELSGNFVRIAKEQAIGGSILLAEGGDTAYTCPGDGTPDPVVVTADGSSTGGYVYVLTDDENIIIAVTEQPVVDFEGADPGTYRLWGLAYTGRLLAAPGDDAAETVLSDGCYQLTGNFVTVVHETPVGGTVRLPDGSTEQLSCPSAAIPPVLEFVSEGVTGSAFSYLITDAGNIIQAIPAGDSFDFSTLPNGSYRVWGLAYSGELLAQPGDDAGRDPLSDNCFALSGNFIRVVNQEPAGGSIATEAGATEIFTCPGDGNADIVRFDSSGVTGRYTYLITGADNVILSVVQTDSFDFEAATLPVVCRVWGLAYIGELLAEAGQNATETPLASDCFELSANFIQVLRAVPDAGAIAVQEPEGEFSFCAGDGRPDLMVFTRNQASPTPYYYLLTDEANRLITYTTTDRIDIDTTGGGAARIWGFTFTGTPNLVPGAVITETMLSDDCYDLSENNIFIDRTGVDGATLSSNLGEGPVFICRGDGVDDVLTFSNNSSAASAEYVYAITNVNNTILRIVEGDQQNFENLGLPELRVWGISYTGNLTASAGQNIETVMLSDGCYALSDNFIHVLLDQPAGGVIQTTDGLTDLAICIGIDEALLTFENSSNARLGYRYLLTDNANTIVAVLDGSTLDFSTIGNGNYRIWGLSYSSPLLAAPGLDADSDPLAGSCYELSANFIAVRKGGPIDGASINTIDGATTVATCPQNGIPDLIVLENSSSAVPQSSYRYLITGVDDRIIIPDVEGNVIDFDGAPAGIYRIYGLSYTGTFMASFGQDIFASVLSDECYELSANFVTVEHLGPQGGQITTADGLSGTFATAACGGEVSDALSFTDNGSATDADGYAFLISRRDTILAVLEEGENFDFSTLPCDNDYLVQGLAYTGTLPDLTGATIGDLVSGELISTCFDFSDNQIVIAQPEGGLQEEPGELRYRGAENQQLSDLRLAPVPVRDRLQVRFELSLFAPERGELLLIDGAGKVVQRLTVGVQNGVNLLEVDVSHLPEGLFFLHLRTGQAMRYERFVKVR